MAEFPDAADRDQFSFCSYEVKALVAPGRFRSLAYRDAPQASSHLVRPPAIDKRRPTRPGRGGAATAAPFQALAACSRDRRHDRFLFHATIQHVVRAAIGCIDLVCDVPHQRPRSVTAVENPEPGTKTNSGAYRLLQESRRWSCRVQETVV